MTDELRLIEKLRSIEALFAGATTPGERDAADRARQRIIARLAEVQSREAPEECQLSTPDPWSRRVLVALLRRYGLRPYRYRRQRQSTVMVRVSPSFVQEVLGPEFNRIAATLHEYLNQVTERVVAEVLDGDKSDAATVEGAPHAGTAVIEP
jgi:hypothetical protein